MSAFYDQASLVVVPSGYKSGKIYAQKPLTTDGQLSFSRASTATRVNSAGLIETVSSNVPRLDYLGSTCPKLQLEPQRTNVFPNSETTATWAFTNMTRTANHGISPDGTQDADLLAPTTSGVVTFTSDSTTSSLTIGQPFVCSFFIKLNQSFNSNSGQNIIDLRLGGSAMWARPSVRINLVTGSVTAIQNASYLSSTNYGNGWFRITFGAIPTGTTSVTQLQIPTGTTMDGGSFYIWGLQGEANATYATSYVKTTTAAVTRLADACSKTGISSLIGQMEGWIYGEVEGLTNSYGTKSVILSVNDGSSLNRVELSFNATTGYLTPRIYKAGTTIFVNDYFKDSLITKFKFAINYGAGRAVFYVNGTKIHEVTSLTFFTSGTLTKMGADNYNGGEAGFGRVSSYLIGKTNLTNAQLAELTAL